MGNIYKHIIACIRWFFPRKYNLVIFAIICIFVPHFAQVRDHSTVRSYVFNRSSSDLSLPVISEYFEIMFLIITTRRRPPCNTSFLSVSETDIAVTSVLNM